MSSASDAATGLLGGLLYTAGNATLGAGDVLAPTVQALPAGPVVNGVLQQTGEVLTNTGQSLGEGGLGTVAVGGQTVLGSGDGSSSGALGVAVASPTQPEGSLVTAGVVSGGQTATVAVGAASSGSTATTASGQATTLVGVQAGGAPVIGAGATPLIGVSAGSATPVQGTLATVGVLSNGQPVSASVGDVTAVLSGGAAPLTAPVTAPALAPVVSTVTNVAEPVVGATTNLLAPVAAGTAPVTATLAVVLGVEAGASPQTPTTPLGRGLSGVLGGRR